MTRSWWRWRGKKLLFGAGPLQLHKQTHAARAVVLSTNWVFQWLIFLQRLMNERADECRTDEDDGCWQMMIDEAQRKEFRRVRKILRNLPDNFTVTTPTPPPHSHAFFHICFIYCISITWFPSQEKLLCFAADSEITPVTRPHTHTEWLVPKLCSPLFNTREECYLFLSIHNWKAKLRHPVKVEGTPPALTASLPILTHTHTQRSRTKQKIVVVNRLLTVKNVVVFFVCVCPFERMNEWMKAWRWEEIDHVFSRVLMQRRQIIDFYNKNGGSRVTANLFMGK